MLTLAVLMAAVIAVQMVPGGTEDTSAEDVAIILDNNAGSGSGYSWSGDTLTITDYDNNYTITQNTTDVLPRSIKIESTSSSDTVTITIKDINIDGNIKLEISASVTLLLENTNKIEGYIIVPYNTSSFASLKIDSSTNGSMDVTTLLSAAIFGGGTITINGGIVNATGGSEGAGIGSNGGSGSDGSSTITINGGIVNATGGREGGAGIGGGSGSNGGTITINGGIVNATGGGSGSSSGAGIGGGGRGGSGGTITINGGIVNATGATGGAGIGGGAGYEGGSGGTIRINGGIVNAAGGSGGGAGIGGGADVEGGSGGSGAALTIKSDASVIAFARGDLPAIHASSINGTSTGYFVNAVLDSNLPASTDLVVYADGDKSTPLATLTPPATTYKNFAFMLPGPPSPKNYNIYAEHSGGSQPVIYASSDNPVIVSKQGIGYDEMRLGAVSFVAVTNISDVPNKAVVGTPLTLSGTVSPSGATNKAIIWSVDAGTIGAVIEGSELTASEKGKVTVTATITNGTAAGTDYTKEFTITVSAEGEEGSGGGSNTMLWIGIVAVIIVLLIVAVFLLQKKGIIKGI